MQREVEILYGKVKFSVFLEGSDVAGAANVDRKTVPCS